MKASLNRAAGVLRCATSYFKWGREADSVLVRSASAIEGSLLWRKTWDCLWDTHTELLNRYSKLIFVNDKFKLYIFVKMRNDPIPWTEGHSGIYCKLQVTAILINFAGSMWASAPFMVLNRWTWHPAPFLEGSAVSRLQTQQLLGFVQPWKRGKSSEEN